MKRRRLVSAMAVLVLAASLPAWAGPVTRYQMADGDWIGVSTSTGSFEASQEGVTVLWTGTLNGAFQFTVSGEHVTGTWQLLGFGIQLIDGGGAGQSFEGVGEYDVTGGGSMSGDADTLVLDGVSTNKGTLTVTQAGQELGGIPIDTTEPIPTLEMDVFEVCDEAYGEWDVVVADAFADAGMQQVDDFGALKGVFVAFQGREGFSDLASKILSDAGYTPPERFAAEWANLPEVLGMVRGMLSEFGDLMAAFPDWTYEEVTSTIDKANAALNQLRNLNECELRFIGEDNAERWINVLSVAVRRMLAGLVELNLFSGSGTVSSLRGPTVVPPSYAWQLLVRIAAQTAAIGPGAIDQEAALIGTEQLISVGSKILELSLEPDGSLLADEHVIRVLSTGTAMGWTFTVNGTDIAARTAFADLATGS